MKKSFENFVNEYSNIEELARIVYEQIGASDDEEFFSVMNNVCVCSCGAAGGFNGFIYYSETVKFWRENKNIIKQSLKQLAEDLGDTMIGLVLSFNSVKNNYDEDEVGKALYGNYDEELIGLYNIFSWYALEEVANRAYDFTYECDNYEDD